MTQTEKLRKRIGELMTENEVVKANAIKASATTKSPYSASMSYANARRENQAYQAILEELDKIESEAWNG